MEKRFKNQNFVIYFSIFLICGSFTHCIINLLPVGYKPADFKFWDLVTPLINMIITRLVFTN